LERTPGSRLGPYEIVSRIGAGGMGEVFRARDTRLDREVAIKILPPAFAQNAERQERFRREAKAISQLNHPHICTLHDVGHEDGTDFLVMELIDGESLADRLVKGPLPLAQVLRYGSEIAGALERAHRAGVVHRDLKPGNIMITKSGAKLLDFGLAKSGGLSVTTDGATDPKPLTADGSIVGTLQYMAPEQIEGGAADGRTDIFALGVVLYEMATGKRAFDGKTRTSIIAAIVASDPQPLSELQPLAPMSLEHLIARCIAKDPDERWQSAADLKWELLRIQSDPTGSDAKESRSRGSRVAWTVAAAAIVLSAVLASIAVRRTSSPRPIRFTVGPPSGWTFTMDNNMGPPAVSPDGRYVAFPARDDISGRVQIWVRDLAATQSVALAGTEGAGFVFWSPTSGSIGFFAGGNLKRVDLSGGDPQTICPAEFGRGGTWSQYNEIVFAPSTDSPLYRVSASGGVPQQLTRFEAARGDLTHRWPYFLPDGKHFVFLIRGPSNAEHRGDAVYVAGVDSPRPRLLLHASSNVSYTDAGYLLYLRDQTLLAQRFNLRNLQLESTPVAVTNERMQYHPAGFGLFSSSRTGVLAYGSGSHISSLLWVDRHGHSEPVIAAGADYFAPRLSADQRQILYSLPDDISGNRDLWVFDISRHVSRRVTFHPWDSFAGVLTPDGKQLIFSSNRSGTPSLYIKRVESTDEKLLLGGSGPAFIESMSPDGRVVLFRRTTSGTQNDIYSVPVNGGSATPIVTSPFNDIGPVFSPSGRWIAYASDESGRYEVYVTLYPPNGSRVQISTDGGTQPVWRGDEKELFYVAPGDRITSVAIEQIAGAIKPGAARVIAEIPLRPAHEDEREYDVTRDGQRFIVNSMPRDRRSLPITVVVNWPGDIAQK
jgi:serine/threonine protein kinase